MGANVKIDSQMQKAFTLVELLVVISIIALLLSVLMPSLSRARMQGQKVVCKSNIRQLMLANNGYAAENRGYYVRGSHDLFNTGGGLNRWHGNRTKTTEQFDPKTGSLVSYLGEGKVKRCPTKVAFETNVSNGAFESGCGGYGYNIVGVGSRAYLLGFKKKAVLSSMQATEIRHPDNVLMFADTALEWGYTSKYIIEYSFTEPPYQIYTDGYGIVRESADAIMNPSLHFRHVKEANVGWVDGHISSKVMSHTALQGQITSNISSVTEPIGWFGPDNSLFKP